MGEEKKEAVEAIVRRKSDETAEVTSDDAPQNEPVTPEPPKMELSRRVVDVADLERKPKVEKMAPIMTQVEQASVEDFEALLNATGSAPTTEQAKVGDRVEGYIETIGDRWIYISFNGLEGLADVIEFTDKEGKLTLQSGQTHTFFVTSRKDGTYFLGERLNSKEASIEAMEIAFESGVPIEGRVTGRNKGGFEIDIRGVRAFCPVSQIEQGFCEDPDVHLGQNYTFKVIEFADGGRKLVVSRAVLLKERAEVAAKALMEDLGEGAVLDGVVTRLADFGAFVDIGGVEGMVHRSEIGYAHFDHPSDLLSEGQPVRVTVLSIEESDKGPRISLSMKASMEDPWTQAVTEFGEGTLFTGKVTRLEAFGAFVEIVPGVEGLVHVSELSWDDRVRKPSDIVQKGQHVSVQVLEIDTPRRRISLSLKTAADDPWSDITSSYQIGMEVTGTVDNVQEFGAFVRLSDTVTALLPRSEMNLTRESNPFREYREGQEVTAKVLSVDPEKRRMALTVKESVDASAQGPKSYTDGSTGLGTLGDLLREKLKE